MSGCLLSKLVLRDIRWECAFPSLLFCLSISDKNSSVNIAGRHVDWIHAGCLQSLSILICLSHVHTHTLQFFLSSWKPALQCLFFKKKTFFVHVVHRHLKKKNCSRLRQHRMTELITAECCNTAARAGDIYSQTYRKHKDSSFSLQRF